MNIIKNNLFMIIVLVAILFFASANLSFAVENHNSSRSNKTYPIAPGGKGECVKKGGAVIEKKDKSGKVTYYCQPKPVGIKEEGVK